jgi:hypothetical protein
MKTDLEEIHSSLFGMLNTHEGPLVISVDSSSNAEAKGTKEVMQGRQKVNGHYFASIVSKPKDIRFYFFPIYTHADEFSPSEDLKKSLKGKSCFHINKLSDSMEMEIKAMIEKGVKLYQKDNLI